MLSGGEEGGDAGKHVIEGEYSRREHRINRSY
jgi:hypothetical protein